jgi:predicted alpha/beta superfamily hydrolase
MPFSIKILILIIIPAVIYAQFNENDTVSVSFIVTCKNINPADSVFISGNHPKLGNWNPGRISLDSNADDSWQQTFSFNTGTHLKYKFTRGSWESEALYERGSTPTDWELLVQNDTIITIHILTWKDLEIPAQISGQITGHVKYHKNIKAYGLKPRDLIVWLPPDYDLDLSGRYPVLYMHDGQNLMDPHTAIFNTDWQIDEAADSLISLNLLPPIIIVGIYNSPDRSLEYMETDSGKLYMKLVVDIIKPLIDQTYRTKSGRAHTATGGSSAGGLVSFMLLWEHRDVFSKAACLSTPFKYASESYEINYVDNVRNDTKALPDILLYMDYGDDELDSLLAPGNQTMVQALLNAGYHEGTDFVCYPLTNSRHSESSWAKSCPRFLQFLFGYK